VSTQPGQQAPAFGQQIPQPTFASVRVEFTDGTFREFHVHKPLQTDVTISSPLDGRELTADLGALPPYLMPPALPHVEVSMKAGIAAHQQVITVDSRTENPAATIGKMLALLTEAFDLRKTQAGDDLWRGWEYKAESLLRGEPR
jgi:hypothetical protein